MRSISKYDCVSVSLLKIVSSRIHKISHSVSSVISSSFYSLTIWYRFQVIRIKSMRQISKWNQEASLLRRWNAKLRIYLQCEQDLFAFISILHANRRITRKADNACSSTHSRFLFATYFRRRWTVVLNIKDLSNHSLQRTWIHSRYDSNIFLSWQTLFFNLNRISCAWTLTWSSWFCCTWLFECELSHNAIMKFKIIYHHYVFRKKSRSRRQCDNEEKFDSELFQKMFDERENNIAKKRQRIEIVLARR